MIITIPAPNWPPNGPRPINLKQDVPQVVKLLELAFGEKLGDGRTVRYKNPNSQPAFLWSLNPQYRRLAPGYVWQEDNEIVGNVTLIATKIYGRHIIANVAVHPDFRRRGIARMLMQAVMDQVRARQGATVMLQVVHNNHAAIDLYRSLGFATIGSMTTWRASVSRLREIEPVGAGQAAPRIEPLRRRYWREAFELDRNSLHPDLNWPQPIPHVFYRTGFWHVLSNFLKARQQETWAVMDKNKQLAGIASIFGEWGQPYDLTLRVHPDWQTYLERPLLAKLIRRLRQLSRRNVRIQHPHHDKITSELLVAANFSAERTLTHMRWDVTYDKKQTI